MRPLKLFRRADDRPTLKDRATALKARLAQIAKRRDGATDPQRRIMVAGSLAAAMPLPALAGRAVAAGPHPDAALLAAGAWYERALAAENAAGAAYDVACAPVQAVLDACPPDVIASWADQLLILGGARWPTLVGGYLRHLPSLGDGYMRKAWTGEVLRNAIRQAVPRLGQGGQTPHHIRRWKAILPTVDAFEAKLRRVEAASDYQGCRKRLDAAKKDLRLAIREVDGFTASTAQGLSYLVQVAALDHARGYHLSPNLLHSAANVAGVDLSKAPKPRPDTSC